MEEILRMIAEWGADTPGFLLGLFVGLIVGVIGTFIVCVVGDIG